MKYLIFLNECLIYLKELSPRNFQMFDMINPLIILPFKLVHSLPFNDSPNFMQSVFLLLKVMSKFSANLEHISNNLFRPCKLGNSNVISLAKKDCI